MHCERVSELMSLRLDGELSPAEAKFLDAHLDGCAGCRDTWVALQRISSLFAGAPSVSPPEDFARRVMSRVAQRHAGRRYVWGALLLLLGTGILISLVALPLLWAAGDLAEVFRQPTLVLRGVALVPEFFFIGRALVRAGWLLLSSLFGLVSVPVLGLYLSLALMFSAVWLLVLRTVRPAASVIHVN